MAERRTTKRDLLADHDEVARRIAGGNRSERITLIRRILEALELDVDAIETDRTPDVADLDIEDARHLALQVMSEQMSQMRRVDHREHWLMRQYMADLGFEVVHLNTGEGDMASERVSVERKEDDLLPSLFDQRRLRQLTAMREEAEFSFLVVTKSWDDVKKDAAKKGMSTRTLIGYIASLSAVGYPPLFIDDRFDAALLIDRIVEKIEDDTPRVFVPRPKKADPAEYRNALIESLPGVGLKTRRALVKRFGSIASLSNASIDELMEIDGIGKKTAERIHSVFNA